MAKSLGISFKKFLGWQPTEGDEIEWDEAEREWMIALQRFENSQVCPLCGMPKDFCHDEEKVRATFSRGGVETCFVSALREQAVSKFNKSGTVETPHSQTTKLVPRVQK